MTLKHIMNAIIIAVCTGSTHHVVGAAGDDRTAAVNRRIVRIKGDKAITPTRPATPESPKPRRRSSSSELSESVSSLSDKSDRRSPSLFPSRVHILVERTSPSDDLLDRSFDERDPRRPAPEGLTSMDRTKYLLARKEAARAAKRKPLDGSFYAEPAHITPHFALGAKDALDRRNVRRGRTLPPLDLDDELRIAAVLKRRGAPTRDEVAVNERIAAVTAAMLAEGFEDYSASE